MPNKIKNYLFCRSLVTNGFFVVTLFFLTALLIFKLTIERVPYQEFETASVEAIINPEASSKDLEKDSLSPYKDKPQTNLDLSRKSNENSIWCEVRDYEDISHDPIFDEFSSWLKIYKYMACEEPIDCQNLDHDPRKFARLIHIGKKIAQRRSKVLSKIIRGDPKRAFELALPREELDDLPKPVSQEMENWEVDTITVSAQHVCFDLNHPRGIIQRKAHLGGARTFRAWTYGKYGKLPTISNLPIIGLSLGEDLAISEDPFLVVEKAENVGSIVMAQESFNYSNIEEKLIAIKKSNRRVGQLARIEHPKVKGKRKILFMTARFLDETTHYETIFEETGSHELITNELGEAVLQDIQVDPYEPVSAENLQQAISEVKDFYMRNTDGEFEIVPVVLPTLTLPISMYAPMAGSEGPNQYDSEANETARAVNAYKELGLYPFHATGVLPLTDPDYDDEGLMGHALDVAQFLNDDWDIWNSRAFWGVSKISLKNGKIDTNFTSPPEVTLEGGADSDALTKFSPAQAEVILDEDGDVISIQVLDPGAFYQTSPNILLNGQAFTNEFDIIVENMLVSVVLLTNFGSGGLGSVGNALLMSAQPPAPFFPVAHVKIESGQVSSSLMAHEIGHNLGLWHAERYFSRSEKPVSEDGDVIEYGNPYSVMGDASDIVTGGDLTVPGKIGLYYTHKEGNGAPDNPQDAALTEGLARKDDPIGYKLGVNAGADVADLNQSILTNNSGGFFAEPGELNPTYRIYRNNYHSGPLPLKEANFTLLFPESKEDELNATFSPYDLKFLGSGEDANGTLHHIHGLTWNLSISNGGRGFVDEPLVQVFDYNESNYTPILSIDPAWIFTPNGRENNVTASLLDNNRSNRWIRGLRIACTEDSRKPLNVIDESKDPPLGLVGFHLSDYFLSYRSDVSSYGLALHLGTRMGPIGSAFFPWVDPFMLDATPQTPQNFDDAALLIGSTYSDYDADIHFTPVRKGGNEPMPYLEVVVNIGSVNRGEARAPSFDLITSSITPAVGDEVSLSIKPLESNVSYAYSWFVNEQALDDLHNLNQSDIILKIDTAKRQVVRAVVSDMRGGVASRNIIISAQGEELTNLSTITGSVRSGSGMVQGARAILAKAPLIEHNVSLVGDLFYSFFPDGEHAPAQYSIDGDLAPELLVRRGEIHRFYFDKSMDGHPFSFLKFQENTPPRFQINMLAEPQVSLAGSGYKRNPEISYTMSSAFSSYYSSHTGIYTDLNRTTFQLPEKNLISRPYIKSLMQQTNVSAAKVGPLEINELGYYTYGGKGYNRLNIPTVDVHRTSIWEDYNNRNATAIAHIDGIGTISPVNADATLFLNNQWVTRKDDAIIPEITFIGLPRINKYHKHLESVGNEVDDPDNEANVSILGFSTATETLRQIDILNQGKGYEPNSTMAVLHYPTEPLLYWTFDRHESLFEDSNQARHQPSPAWNREIDKINLRHHWQMDKNQSGSIPADFGSQDLQLITGDPLGESNFTFALKNKGVILKNDTLRAITPFDDNFTFSVWVKPEGNFTIHFGDLNITRDTSLNNSNAEYKIDAQGSLNPQVENYWTHLAVVMEDNNVTLFVDGRNNGTHITSKSFSDGNLSITENDGRPIIIDECKIYHAALSESKVRYLAGRTILDLSGNSYNAVTMGTNSILNTPGSNISSTDVPSLSVSPNSPNGSGRLGDSYSGENHGHSITLNGSDQYLDMTPFMSELSIEEGSISLWVKPAALQLNAPLFCAANPYLSIEDNGTFQVSETGTIFAFELATGKPKIGGVLSKGSVVVSQWNHLVGTFGASPTIWINGVRQNLSAPISQTENRFTESFNLASFNNGADLFSIGRSYSRTDDPLGERPSEIFFNGSVDDLAIYERQLSNSEVEYLYDLGKGREQIPRLETIVDAVGTVDVIEGGLGYRENPELVFWYGQNDKNESTLQGFDELQEVIDNFHDGNGDFNGTEGMFVYVNGSVDETEEGVYSYHIGKDSNRSYNWRKGGIANGWRRHIPATGIVENADASLGELVWTHRLIQPIDMVLPDGRIISRKYVDYITTDINRSLPLEFNSSLDYWGKINNKYYQTQGLFGFSEKADLQVEANATTGTPAQAFIYYWIDDEDNDSVTIVDPGHGVTDMNSTLFKISGPGYQPPTPEYEIGKKVVYAQAAEVPDNTVNITSAAEVAASGYNYAVYDWNGSHDVNVSVKEFNKTYSSVSVNNGGFGYSMPVELKVFGGLPQLKIELIQAGGTEGLLLPYDTNLSRAQAFTEAILEVNETNESGAIVDVNIIDPGHGYISYQNYVDLNGDSNGDLMSPHFDGWVNEGNYTYTQFPNITVSGGGGNGATLQPILDENGSIVDVNITNGGRGYFNMNSNVTARITHTSPLTSKERDANLSIRLGGYLSEIGRCSGCAGGSHLPAHLNQIEETYSHLEPWIEIWDRGRPERDIDQLQLRAHASPRVVNGRIEDVIVTTSGYGYIDPVAYVRDAPPKHYKYYDILGGEGNGTSDLYRRKWICNYLRITEDGKKEKCGHVFWSLYPPEECPGETDDELPYVDGNGSLVIATGSDLSGWLARHQNNSRDHLYCRDDENTTRHLSAGFLSRKCWGTKENFVLYNDKYYRNGENWLPMDANLSVITEGGRIREIVVDNKGFNYYASQIEVVGSGTGVDAIPIFDEYGTNTKVIFHDHRQRNLEFDIIERPDGAGQGFVERPWSWDSQNNSYYKNSVSGNPYYSWVNAPLTGSKEDLTTFTKHSQADYIKLEEEGQLVLREAWEYSGGDWQYGRAVLADALGDRIVDVQLLDPGYYENSRTDFGTITVDFNSSHVPDHDKNGSSDFVEANLTAHTSRHLTYLKLDGNASYGDNSSPNGLFNQTPIAQIIYEDQSTTENPTRGVITYDTTDLVSDYIRLNNRVLYDPLRELSFVDLYIDDRFPNQLYYGYGRQSTTSNPQNLPAMGGKIIVSESLPGQNWAVNEPLYKPHFSYTDEFGQYAFTELEPGMYNLAVLMEDQGYQESTFRPDANPTRVSQFVYIPGFPELTLEADNGGWGTSRLVWSRESRQLSRPFFDYNYTTEFQSEYLLKILEGIGRGFLNPLDPNLDPEAFPELIFIPHSNNISKVTPNVIMGWDSEHDGSMALMIVDDENTSRYYPGDKFTVRFSSVVEGQDFFESYIYTESNQSFDSGVLASWGYDASEANRSRYVAEPRLIILPDDSGGANPIEAKFKSVNFEPLFLSGLVLDANGFSQNIDIDWQIHLDFNASDGNNSRIAELQDPAGNQGLNILASEQVELYLFSTLREGVGSIHGFEIVSGGNNYSDGDRILLSGDGYGYEANVTVDNNGSIVVANVSMRGFNISEDTEVSIWNEDLTNLSSGTGAILRPIFPNGYLEVEANATFTINGVDHNLSEKVRIRPSMRTTLTNQQKWLNKYTDSFRREPNDPWWNEDDDNASDSNLNEWLNGTNPLNADTDGDNRTDVQELTAHPQLLNNVLVFYTSNPLSFDTDGDGLNDMEEFTSGTNPNLRDTDLDGLVDTKDDSPTSATGNGIFSGLILISQKYLGEDHNIYFQEISQANYDPVDDDTNWTLKGTNAVYNFYNIGKEQGNFTIRSFIDFPSLGTVGKYNSGEPFIEHNFTLGEGEKKYGLNLLPVDPPPTIRFKDNNVSKYSNLLIEVSETVPSTDFEWGVEAFDELFGNSPFSPDVNNTYGPIGASYVEYDSIYRENNLSFLIEGNFTQFLSANDANSSALATFDLVNIPVGTWGLSYQAIDEHNNTSSVLDQNITILDAQAPFVTILDSDNQVMATTLDISDVNNSNIIGSSALGSYDVNETNNSVVWTWNYGTEFSFSNWTSPAETGVRIHIMDTKDELISDWNVTITYHDIDYNESLDNNISGFNQRFDTNDSPISIDPDALGAYVLNDSASPGTYRFRFRAKDRSDNNTTFDLFLEVRAGHAVEITAVDGYLENALVIFDSNNDGISDINREFFTDSNGRANIILSKEEFKKIDTNSNGRLDSFEGKFIVVGGIDTSTGAVFSGKLIADANSTVVSPLTTMISRLMDLGASKPEAISALAIALDLDPSIDYTVYDPIEQAFNGDSEATKIMSANLRMANLVNQAEGLLLTLSSDYQGYAVGTYLLGEVAKYLQQTQSGGVIDLESALIEAIPIALASVGTAGELALEDQLAMFQLMAELDNSLLESTEPSSFEELMTRQKVIIDDMASLYEGLESNSESLELTEYNLILTAEMGGVVSSGGTYPYGSKVAITATALDGYNFTNWIGEGITDPNASSSLVLIIKDRNITAQFSPTQHEIFVSASQGGTVSGSGSYAFNQTIQIIASPEIGFQFDGWEGHDYDQVESPSLEILVTEPLSLTATFSKLTHTLSITSSDGGTVTGGGGYAHGGIAVIQALPEEDYVFSGWTGTGLQDSDSLSTQLAITADTQIHATFEPRSLNKYGLVLESVPSQGGTTSGSGVYDSGETVRIVAQPLAGYEFVGWEGAQLNEANESNTTLLVTEDTSLSARFRELEYRVEVVTETGGSVSGSGTYKYGETVIIEAVPLDGYEFAGWEGAEVDQYSQAQTTVFVDGNLSVQAKYNQLEYELTVTSGEGGSVTGGGTYTYGEIALVSAQPQGGYLFAGWEGLSSGTYEGSTIEVVVMGQENLRAKFVPATHVVTLSASTGGSVIGGGVFEHGQTVNIEAIAETGYHFVEWEGGEISDPNASQSTLQVLGESTIRARFARKVYDLVLTTETGGTVTGGGIYKHGEIAVIQALPEEDYSFNGWTGTEVQNSESLSTQLEITADTQIHATFEPRSLNKYGLVLESVPSQGGTTSGSGVYDSGETVRIIAQPLAGYEFAGWEGAQLNEANESNTTLLVTEDTSLSARFRELEYRVEVVTETGGSVSGSGTYKYGETVIIEAVPLDGYEFAGWEGAEVNRALSSITTISVTSDIAISGRFQLILHKLETLHSEGGFVEGGGNFQHGKFAVLQATPATGYKFAGWEGGAASDASSPSIVIHMVEDNFLYAKFEKIKNFFTPSGENFSLWINDLDYEKEDWLYSVSANDHDGDSISYSILSGNPNLNDDFDNMFKLSVDGHLRVNDPNEIELASGSSIKLIISLDDGAGKSSQIAGEINIANLLLLKSQFLGGDWYHSSWLGDFYAYSNGWIYHNRLKWLFIHVVDGGGFWIWDSQLNSWMWTNAEIFPWLYRYDPDGWVYQMLDSDVIKVFDYRKEIWTARE